MKRNWSLSLYALVGAMIVLGCGGSGVGIAPAAVNLVKTPTPTKLTLPAGAPAMSALKVWTSIGEATPSPSGDVTVEVFNNGPQYAEVRNAAGEMVAAGFVGGARRTLNLDTTAEMLTYFAVGGPLQRGSKTSQALVLAGIKSLSGFPAVVDAVKTTFAAKGFVSAEEPAIRAALDAVVDAIVPNPPSTTRGADVAPTKEASGLEINNDVNDQIRITNHSFRRAYMWLIRTGFKDVQGNTRELAEGIAAQPVVMPSRYGGSVDSATGLIKGDYSWVPAAMQPHPVASEVATIDNEEEIYYQLVTVGVGKSAGDFDDLTLEQFKKWQELVYWTAYLDFYLPVFANLALPLNGDSLDDLSEFAYRHQLAQAFATTGHDSMPTVASLAAQGRFPDALRSFVNSSRLDEVNSMMAKIMIEWGRKFGSSLFTGEQDLVNRVHTAKNRIGMIGLADAVGRMAPLGDLMRADHANIFRITSARSTVKLVSDAEEIGLQDTANIEAIIKNKQAGVTYRYEWSVDNSNFFLQDVDGKSTDESPGGILKSAHARVFIGNLSNNEGTPTITCKVYNGNTLIGIATTRVAFRNKVREGTATFVIKSRITPNPANPDQFNTAVVALAEVPHVQNAAHYAIVIEDKNGQDIKRTNWSPNKPPTTTDTIIWQQKPSGVYWVTIQGDGMVGYVDAGTAAQTVANSTAFFQNKYAGIKMKVTVYFD